MILVKFYVIYCFLHVIVVVVVEEETDLNQYANSEYFPDGLTPPMKVR